MGRGGRRTGGEQGRPTLPPGEARDVQLGVRIQERHYLALRRLMEREGLGSLSSAVRWLIESDGVRQR